MALFSKIRFYLAVPSKFQRFLPSNSWNYEFWKEKFIQIFLIFLFHNLDVHGWWMVGGGHPLQSILCYNFTWTLLLVHLQTTWILTYSSTKNLNYPSKMSNYSKKGPITCSELLSSSFENNFKRANIYKTRLKIVKNWTSATRC